MSVFRSDALAGKTALITGGGSGIGLGISEVLLDHGADVAILSRSEERLQAAAAALLADRPGRRCLAVPGDVRDEAAIAAAVERVMDEFGRIDILINGAAGNFLAPAVALTPKGYRTVLDIDAVGTFTCSRAVFDAWMGSNGGAIINISATLQYVGTPMQLHAAGAKAAIDVQTKTLAVEWGPLGIRVNGVAPGPIDGTEGMSRLAPAGVKSKLTGRIPLRRLGTPHDIGMAVLFLSTDAASWITGETLVVDGGDWLDTGLFELFHSA